MGYYEVLDAMYNNKGEDFNLTEHNASSLILHDLYSKLGHTKEQFVVRYVGLYVYLGFSN